MAPPRVWAKTLLSALREASYLAPPQGGFHIHKQPLEGQVQQDRRQPTRCNPLRLNFLTTEANAERNRLKRGEITFEFVGSWLPLLVGRGEIEHHGGRHNRAGMLTS